MPAEREVYRVEAESRAAGFEDDEIAKGHFRIIFDKLQVQRRTEAVARARELGLL